MMKDVSPYLRRTVRLQAGADAVFSTSPDMGECMFRMAVFDFSKEAYCKVHELEMTGL
jgi:coenzyme F420-reducing hydrogenase delta subunit